VHPVRLQRNQPRAEARLAELLADPAHQEVSEHAVELRRRLGPYLPADVVDVELRRLGADASSQTAQVLMYVAGPYVRRGQWVSRSPGDGGYARASAAVDAVFTRHAAPMTSCLLDALTGLGMPSGVVLTYLETQVALRRFGDVWVRWAGDTTRNMTEAVLHVLGAPATAETIVAMIDCDRVSLSAVNAVLSDDDRFVRASRRRWGLRAWGITEYFGIAHAIGAHIDASGGKVVVKDLITDLREGHPDVAESSIRSYLGALEFVTKAGVQRGTNENTPG
jgi:hypothetical protein